ncbi:hypothetical protein ABRY23_12845 [Melioribacteraceae bacterium 4301-Me]|uniref:hypothetical protein n=1 Tax=Pyranulibacter aquaticus TaxID=3163344 RepID=UPI0035988A31
MKNLLFLGLFVLLSACNNNKRNDPLASSTANFVKEMIESTSQDIETYNKNVRHFFSFVRRDVLNENDFANHSIYSASRYELSIDRQNNIMSLVGGNTGKNVKIRASSNRPSNSPYHLIGNGEMYINEQKVLLVNEKFGDKKLEATLFFPTLTGDNYIRILFNHDNKVITSNSNFNISIEVKFADYQKSFNYINSPMNVNQLYEFANEIKSIFPHQIFEGIDHSFYSTCVYLNNKWLKWESDIKLSQGFIVLDQNSKRLMKEPCYGNDDLWASTLTGIVVGFFSFGAGAAYALIDAYIASEAEPC